MNRGSREYELSRLEMVDRHYNYVSHTLLVITTRAMRKFVQEHDGVQVVPVLDKILASLEADDFKAASKLFKTVHFGAYGFGDWFPPVKFANEDQEYVQVVFEALVERWHRLMKTAAGKAR